MKTLTIKSLFILLLALTFSTSSYANHVLGGEVSWSCNNNGDYVFEYKRYHSCAGFSPGTSSLLLNVSGATQPTNNIGSVINAITLSYDTSIEISANCDPQSPYYPSCLNGSLDAINSQIFRSQPITLNGQAPASGWHFYIDENNTNSTLNLSGPVSIYRATIYQNSSGSCLDNSPRFISPPNFFYCSSIDYKMSFAAIDIDGDSLTYQTAQSYSTFPGNPISFNSPYSLSQITPGPSQNSLNHPLQYDPKNGAAEFRIEYGSTNYGWYQFSRKVNSYRNGVLIASVYRDLPILIENCLDLRTNQENEPPVIDDAFFKPAQGFTSKDTFMVGSSVVMNIGARDTNTFQGNFQEIKVQILGSEMAKNYHVQGNCVRPNDTSCAFVLLPNTTVDPRSGNYEFNANVSFSKQLNWNTDCSDLDSNGSAKTHYFMVRAQDDFCPVPGISYKTIAVTIVPDPNNPCNLSTNNDELESNKTQLEVYPNPTQDKVNLHLGEEESVELRLRSIDGKLLTQKQYTNQQQISLEVEGPSGIYFLELRTQSGKTIFKKLIKQ